MTTRKNKIWKAWALILTVVLACAFVAGFAIAEEGDVELHDYFEYYEPNGHDWSGFVTVTPATCCSDGSEMRTCTFCGATEYRTIPATGAHQWVDNTVPATCESGGYTTHTCAVCGSSYTDGQTSATGHSFGGWSTTANATCASDGSEIRSCAYCGATESRSIPATGNHQWTTSTVNATCESGGYTTHTCSTCGASYTDGETGALGHAFSDWTTSKAATCSADGVKTRSCSRCGKTESATIPASGNHNYQDSVVKATCESGGYTTHTCSVCGSSYRDSEVAALGHSFGEWTTTKAATCIAEGTQTRTCSRCGKTETKSIPATGKHDYETKVVKATCEEGGYTMHTCKICGESYWDSQTPALGHNFRSWSTKKSATCATEGMQTRTCRRCGTVETRTIPKSEKHAFKDKTVKATCTEGGYTEHTCAICGYTCKDNITPANGHNWADWYVMTPASCSREGKAIRGCKTCNEQESKVLPKNDTHLYTDRVVPGTCAAEGYTEHICKNCGYTYKDNPTPKTSNHSYVTSVVAPTCNSKGYTLHKCRLCGSEYKDNYTEKTSHCYQITETTATCQHAGVQTFTCKYCGDTYKKDAPQQSCRTADHVVVAATPTAHGSSYYVCKWCGKQSTPTEVEHYYVATAAQKPSGSSNGSVTFTCTVCGDSYTTKSYDEALDYGIELSKTSKSEEEKLQDIFTASHYYTSDCVIASARIANMCRTNGITCKIVSIHDDDQQARFGYTEADKEKAAKTGFYPNGIGINHHWVVCTINGKDYEYGL